MGWNGSGETAGIEDKTPLARNTQSAGSRAWKGIFAGLVIVIIPVTAYLALHENSTREIPAKNPQYVKVETQVKSPVAKSVASKQNAGPAQTNCATRMELGVEVVSSSFQTNSNGGVTEYMTLADGRKISKYTPPKPVFSSSSDQMLAMLLSAKPGQALPPMPGMSSVDKDFVQALLTPIKISEDDSDQIKELKQQVIDARATLVAEIKEGKTVREVLEACKADLDKIADTHEIAKQQLSEIKKNEGDEAAADFLKRVNEKFREQGIPEIEGLKRRRIGK